MKAIQECAFVFQQQVAWGDMDAFGHVNNVMYYRYIESARIEYLTHINALQSNLICVIASSNCRYLQPVFYPDTLKIGVNVVELRNSGFRMSYHLYSTQSGQLVATSEAVIVMMRADTYEKAALTSELKNKMTELEARVGNTIPSESMIPSGRDVIASSRDVITSSRDVINELGRSVRDTVIDTVRENIEQILPKIKK